MLFEPLFAHARNQPQEPAVKDDSGQYSYQQLPAIAPKLPSPASNDLAVIMYTSGTSGLPKGVMLTYGNLASDVESAIEHAQLKGRHKFLGIIPLFHSTGMLATMIAPVHLGAQMV